MRDVGRDRLVVLAEEDPRSIEHLVERLGNRLICVRISNMIDKLLGQLAAAQKSIAFQRPGPSGEVARGDRHEHTAKPFVARRRTSQFGKTGRDQLAEHDWFDRHHRDARLLDRLVVGRPFQTIKKIQPRPRRKRLPALVPLLQAIAPKTLFIKTLQHVHERMVFIDLRLNLIHGDSLDRGPLQSKRRK